MTKRLAVMVCLILGLGAATLWAADFWEKKTFGEWSDKEVQKMLNDSPWARSVDVPLSGMAGRGGGGGGGRGRRGGGGGGGIPSAASGPGGGGGGLGGDEGGGGGGGISRAGGGGGFDGPEVSPTMRVTVRWHSALPVRQAVARARFGAEAGTSAEAAKTLEQPQNRHIIGLAGLPPQMMRANPEQLKSNAVLKPKGKEPITAEQVQGERDPQGRVNLYLVFPREVNGAPAIALEDGDVELAVKLGPMEIKRKFRLKDMVYEGKLEI